MKVIVEIDGVRHKMVRTRKRSDTCVNCSLEKVCTYVVDSACLSGYYRFRKCKEGE